ncbi:MAG: hypothetical protein QOG23_4827 [Blastocatellia bacterium]|jgi:WD40 repeat protein/serine/threonine protein kinase|nr:hypothetical protein [Blastocatellia bacterium]
MSQDEKSSTVSVLRLPRSPSVLAREDGVPAVWDIGDVILHLYEVKDVFWPGARGLVYRVHHREWNIDLAVKSPRETPFEIEGETEAFVKAADAWVRLGLFPHIVSCYYVRTLRGIPRLFLEFVEGGSLHDWIHSRRLYEGGTEESLKRILDISIQFAWGLEHAHAQGLIHADVKPGNLLLTSDGCAKVKGFGLNHARVRPVNPISEASIDRTATVPTSTYGAPEQAGNELSCQTDIWSWAASVLEMFTGEWRWGDGELSEAALENYRESGTQGGDVPQIPVAVADLLRECLKSDATQRPSGMGKVANALREIYQEVTGSAHPRQLPIQVNTGAEALNNRALSLLDLGKTAEAMQLWDEALVVKPQHAETTYNRGLLLWRAGNLTDDALVRLLEGLKHSEANDQFINYLLSLVHRERDDTKAAAEALESSEGSHADNNEVGEAISLRNKGLQSERPFTAFSDDEVCGPNLFSPDGKNLFLTVSGFKIRILDFNAPVSARYLHGHAAQINALTISAKGSYALTSSEDGTIRLWDVPTGKCLQSITDDTWPHADLLALSADGKYAVLRFEPWSEKATLQLWDVRAGHRLRDFETTVSEFGEPQSVAAVAISPNAKYVLSGGDYGTVSLWDVTTGKLLRYLKGLQGPVRFVQFHPDGKRCSAANNCEVREFDLNSGVCVEVTTVDEPDGDSKMSLVTVSADGNYALFGSSHGQLRLWEVNTGRCLRTFQDLTGRDRYEVERYEGITSIGLSVDGRYSLSGTKGGSYTLWRFSPDYHAPLIFSRVVATEESLINQGTGEENLALARKAIAEDRFTDAANLIRSARAVPGYERSAEAVELWTRLYVHLPRTRVKASWPSHMIAGQQMARSMSFDADGKYVLFGGFNMELKEVATGKCLRVFDKAINGNAALSGDGRLAMIGGWESYELWDVTSGGLIERIYSCHEKHVKDIQMSVDGKYAASCTEDTLNLWEITPEGLSYLRSTKTDWGTLSALAISSDNKYCVGGTGFSSMRDHDYSLRLWELPSGECIRTFKGYDSGTYALVFSPDNKYFLGAGFDHKLRLWEVATGESMRLFEGHTQPVYSVDISADGKFALSGGSDGTLRLWEVATGECLRTWEIKTDYIGPVRFTSDCKYILAGTRGPILRVEMLDWELEDDSQT